MRSVVPMGTVFPDGHAARDDTLHELHTTAFISRWGKFSATSAIYERRAVRRRSRLFPHCRFRIHASSRHASTGQKAI